MADKEVAVETPKKKTAKEKYPELWAQFEKLQAEKAKLDAVVAPLRDKRDAVVAEMAPLEAKARELAKEIKQHLPRLGELDQQLAALARAMGGKSMSDNAA